MQIAPRACRVVPFGLDLKAAPGGVDTTAERLHNAHTKE